MNENDNGNDDPPKADPEKEYPPKDVSTLEDKEAANEDTKEGTDTTQQEDNKRVDDTAANIKDKTEESEDDDDDDDDASSENSESQRRASAVLDGLYEDVLLEHNLSSLSLEVPKDPPPPAVAADALPAVATQAEPTPTVAALILDDVTPIPHITQEIRQERLDQGLCPMCGTQLFETKKKIALNRYGLPKKTTETKPLDVEGHVFRGHCLKCLEQSTNTPTTTSQEAFYSGLYNDYGEFEGDGQLIWNNGDRFVGEFRNGQRYKGTLYFADGSEYVGTWYQGKMHGDGTRRYAEGSVYSGQFRHGQRHGQGRCYFANGDLAVGEWKHDQLDGFGRYYYSSGRNFEGFFRAGMRLRGKYGWTDGTVEIFRYENDQRVGEGVRWSPNRKKAWRVSPDGKFKKKITLLEASNLGKALR